MTVLDRKSEVTRFQILVKVAAGQPQVKQSQVADSLGITPQAVSEYIKSLAAEGMIRSGGRGQYTVTPLGVEAIIAGAKELREYSDYVLNHVVGQVAVWAAIAREPLAKGDTVFLAMDEGILYAGCTGTGASGNQAVADLIAATPNSIGYIELTYATRGKLSHGQVQNAAGRFVKAELWSVTAAAAESANTMPEDFRVSITNAPGENAYPISSFTWILVPVKIADAAKRRALVTFMNWGLTDGQTFADSLSYSRLPDAVIKKTQAAISQIQ